MMGKAWQLELMQQVTLHPQEAERGEIWYSVHFLLFIQSRTPDHGMMKLIG